MVRYFQVAAVAAVLSAGTLVATSAVAQTWRDDGYYRGNAAPPAWGPYGRPEYGYRDYGVDTGITDIAVCPPGYHIGHSGELRWPNR